MKNYTAEEVAKIIGIRLRAVQRACARLCIAKFGKNYIIPENRIKDIKNHTYSSPGNPEWKKKCKNN